MIKALKNMFSGNKNRKYSGFSDFFLHASPEEKKKVITEAARKSNDDQLQIFNKARLKVGVN